MIARPSVIAPTRKLIRSSVVAVFIETVIIEVFLFCLTRIRRRAVSLFTKPKVSA
jgi:hypothetical protein